MIFLAACTVSAAWGEQILTGVPMHQKSAQTFYVEGRIGDLAPDEFMVDTGSSYTMINEHTLEQLLVSEMADYVRDLTGVLANGDELLVPVYRVTSLRVGESCHLSDIEVAVFPGRTRQILGLSTLRRASPFLFSMEPPELRLSNCYDQLSQSSN
jgi:predicted aspartyl protease